MLFTKYLRFFTFFEKLTYENHELHQHFHLYINSYFVSK